MRKKKPKYIKMNRSKRDLFFKLPFSLLHMFLLSFYCLQVVKMIANGVAFDLYCGDRFDRIVAFFFLIPR